MHQSYIYIYIYILIINFDIHLNFDSIHYLELHIILQEAERNGSVSYGELYNKVHKKRRSICFQ